MGATDVLIKGIASLGSSVNKLINKDASDTEQGIVSNKMPELTLKVDNKDILDITTKWEKKWSESEVKSRLDKESGENQKYWLGKHFTSSFPSVDGPTICCPVSGCSKGSPVS